MGLCCYFRSIFFQEIVFIKSCCMSFNVLFYWKVDHRDIKFGVIYLKRCIRSLCWFNNLLTMMDQALFHSWSKANRVIFKFYSNVLLEQQLCLTCYYHCYYYYYYYWLVFPYYFLFIFKRSTCNCPVVVYPIISSIFIRSIIHFISLTIPQKSWCHRIVITLL